MIVSCRRVAGVMVLACVVAAMGCRKPIPPEPDYAKPLPPGAFGLRKITDPAKLPDIASAAESFQKPGYKEALGRSLGWFRLPSTPQYFPSGPITHEHAWASVFAMSKISERSGPLLASRILQEFDVWESVGWDGSGTVLYTGYYTPVFKASRTPDGVYQFPIYSRPSDLVSDPATGKVLSPYPTRSQLVTSGRLRGLELVYFADPLDAYIVEVNGSAKLNMTDGSTLFVGFAGTNGHDYTSIGKLLAAEGKLDKNRISLATIRAHFKQNPQQLQGYINRNDRFVFFKEYDGKNWPAGSLGFRVTPWHSLATDKDVFPRGTPTLVMTDSFDDQGRQAPFRQFMVDQDTGGAIRAAGRGDIYYGVGDRAEWFAGRQNAEGRLYYFLLKDDRIAHWMQQLRAEQTQPIRGPM